jgi:flagellar biosynthesis component FlhA
MILLDVDPNIVRPGWTPLFVVLLLAVAMVFLYFSMRKQFRKIRSHEAADQQEDSTSEHQPGGA